MPSRPVLHVVWRAHRGINWIAHLKLDSATESSLCGRIPAASMNMHIGQVRDPRTPHNQPPITSCELCQWRLVRLTKEFDVVLHPRRKGEPRVIFKE